MRAEILRPCSYQKQVRKSSKNLLLYFKGSLKMGDMRLELKCDFNHQKMAVWTTMYIKPLNSLRSCLPFFQCSPHFSKPHHYVFRWFDLRSFQKSVYILPQKAIQISKRLKIHFWHFVKDVYSKIYVANRGRGSYSCGCVNLSCIHAMTHTHRRIRESWNTSYWLDQP